MSDNNPTKWWQWVLLYPTLAISILGAIPTFTEFYQSEKLDVDFGNSQKAVEQRTMWEKNLTCTSAPFDWLKTSSNILVDATICRSGDVLVRVKAPENKQFYEWVPVNKFMQRVASNPFISSAIAAELNSELNLELNNETILAETGATVLCQRWIDKVKLLRRVLVTGQGCYDEVVNTLTGVVVSHKPAPCNKSCR